jgi:hypothetical protein
MTDRAQYEWATTHPTMSVCIKAEEGVDGDLHERHVCDIIRDGHSVTMADLTADEAAYVRDLI